VVSKETGDVAIRAVRKRDEGQSELSIERRNEIMAAAASAFMENGYAATSIDTVADLMGCTRGLIYYHFKNKADLFFSIHRYVMEMNLSLLEPIVRSERSPRARLRDMVITHAMGVMTRLSFQRVSVLSLEMHIAGKTDPKQRKVLKDIVAMHHAYEDLFVSVIGEGIEAKEFRPCEPRIVTKPLLGGLNWMTMWYRPRARETDDDRKSLAAAIADYLLNGLSSEAEGRLNADAAAAVPAGATAPAPASPSRRA
jgi:AcrR family transcriptional regulator